LFAPRAGGAWLDDLRLSQRECHQSATVGPHGARKDEDSGTTDSYFQRNTATSLSCSADSDCEVSDCRFLENSGTACSSSHSGSLDGCLFEENTGISVAVGGRGSVAIARSIFASNGGVSVSIVDQAGVDIVNSLFYDNTARIVQSTGSYWDSHCTVTSSTFFRNAVTTAGSVIGSMDTRVEILGSILWGNGSDPILASATLDYNDIEGLSGAGTNISLDPLFVSTEPGAAKLTLQESSPCIDRGPPSGIPDLDFAGQARYDVPTVPNQNGSAADLGACEWVPSGP
jgi:hypothetical protein